MSTFHNKCHHYFMNLPEVNVHYTYFQTIEKEFGVISVLFEINAHECEPHSIFMYKWDFYCCLKHMKLNFLCQILVFFSKMMLLD